MLVLLPPSETKADGGDMAPLDLASLAFDDLAPTRDLLLNAIAGLAADLPGARAALAVSASFDADILANAGLRSAPTMPAAQRYTGVLYDMLDLASLPRAARDRALQRIYIASALFGAVRASDPIPRYRLSASSRLPGIGTPASLWKPELATALGQLAPPVLDLRSQAYAAMAPLPGAIGVRVLSEKPDGTRGVVSHFSKAAKGRLARIVATTRAAVDDIGDVVRVARRSGLRLEKVGATSLEMIT